jgi:3-methyladenine DNA glycosylase AlkD
MESSKTYSNDEINKLLIDLSEEKYKVFSQSLIPGITNIIGVRLPKLRKLAKEISKNEWRTYLNHCNSNYFEEVMLSGMVIGCVKADINEILDYTAKFVPKINNWSVCDSFCVGLKVTKDYKYEVRIFLEKYLHSDKEYEIRFAVVMLLNYYVSEDNLEDIFRITDSIHHHSYYVKMAVAWLIATCFCNHQEETMKYLLNNQLDDFTYNKTLQKIVESLKVTKETKETIKSMKRIR